MNNKLLVTAIRRFGLGRNQILVKFKHALQSTDLRVQALDDAEAALVGVEGGELFADPMVEVPRLAWELAKEAVRRGTPKDGLHALTDAKISIGESSTMIEFRSGPGVVPGRPLVPAWLMAQIGLLDRAAQDVRELRLELEARPAKPAELGGTQIKAVINEAVAKAVSTERHRATADAPQNEAEKQRQEEQRRLADTSFGRDALFKLADARPTAARHELEFFIGCGGERWNPKASVKDRGASYDRVRHWLRQMVKCGLAEGDGRIGYRIGQDGGRLANQLRSSKTRSNGMP